MKLKLYPSLSDLKIFLLGLIFTASTASIQAQTTVTIGAGTTSNQKQGPGAYSGSNKYAGTANLIRCTGGTTDMTTWGYISRVGWYFDYLSSFNTANFNLPENIWMNSFAGSTITTGTTFGTFTTGGVNVFTGNVTYGTTTGFVPITLTTPYYLPSATNLMIVSNEGSFNSGAVYFYGTAQTALAAWYGGSAAATSTTTYANNAARGNVQITFSKPTISTQPAATTSLTVCNSTTLNIASTYTTSYQWQYSTTGTAGTWTNVANGTPSGAVYTTGGTSPAASATGSLTVSGINSAGTYYYQCIANNGNGASSNTTSNSSVVTVSGLATPTITGAAAQCIAGATGQVYSVAAISGATAYSWSVPAGWTITGGANTNSITVTVGAVGQNGNISVTATNGSCSSSAATLAVVVDPPITVNPTPSTATSTCAAPISAGAGGGTAGYTYAWTGGLAATATPTVIASGTYTVTVTDSKGCSNTGSTGALTILNTPSVVFTETDASGPANDGQVCSGGGVTLSVPSASGITYTWSNSGGSSNSATFSGITSTTTYTVTADNGSCAGIGSYTVTVYSPSISETITPTNETSCDNGTGSITLSAISGGTGTYTYSWSGPNGYTSTTQNLSGLSAGTYNVTITDAGCVGISGTGSGSVSTPWSATASAASAYLCGPSDALTGGTSGTLPTSSVLTTNLSAPLTSLPTGWTQSLGTYSGYGTASSQCSADPATTCLYFDSYLNSSGTQSSITTPVFSLVGYTTPTLTYGLIYAGSGGTFLVQISTNGGTSYTTLSTNPLNTTSAFVTQTVSLSTYAGASNLKIRFIQTSNYGSSICSDDVFLNNVSVQGYTNQTATTTYSWSGPSGFTSSAQNPSATAAGTYNLSVTAAGCTAKSTVTIAPGPVTLYTVSGGGGICSTGGTSTINLSGSQSGVSYQLYNGATASGSPVSGTGSALSWTVSTAGTYTVIGTGFSCNTQMTGSAVVSSVTTPAGGTVATTNICSGVGGSVSVSGVTNATQYIWALPSSLSGTSTTSSISISSTLVGTYTVTVTPVDVSSGITCSGTPITGTVNIVNTPVMDPAQSTSTCSNAAFTYTPTGTTVPAGITYAWSAPSGTGFTGGVAATNQTNLSATLINSGTSPVTATYTITPTVGCAGSAFTVAVTVNPIPAAVTVSGGGAACGTATLTAGGGTGGTIYWQNTTTNGTSTSNPTSTFAVTTSGTYYFNAQNSYGCFGPQGSATVTVNTIPGTATASATPSTICSGSNSVLTASSTGATNINWWTAATGGTLLTTTANGANYTVAPTANTTYYAEGQNLSPTPTNVSFSYTGAITTWTVPAGVNSVTINAIGASGGYASGSTAGRGANLTGTFAVTPGQVLSILVGQSPGLTSTTLIYPAGGGGTFVANGASYTTATPMIVAGGGGGAYGGSTGTNASLTASGTGTTPGTAGNGAPVITCGGGGGGFYTSGGSENTSIPGYGYTGGAGFNQGGAGGVPNSAYGGASYQTGGFGGGAPADYYGSCNEQAGSGGGYSGGSSYGTGAGTVGNAGGSYNGGTSPTNAVASTTGNGSVTISYLAPLCSSSTRTAVPVTVLTAPGAVTVSGGGAACGSTTITAGGGSGGTIYWENTTSNGTDLSTPSSSQTISSSGTYYFNAYNGTCWGAQGSATVTINTIPAAPSPVVASPGTICVGVVSQLTSTSTGNNTNWWTAATGGTLLTTTADGTNYPVTPGATTTYYAEAQTLGTPTTVNFAYTGSAQSWTVPAGVTSITVDVQGAAGGLGSDGSVNCVGGSGGRVQATYAVTPGQSFSIYVGGKGGDGTGGVVNGAGGYNGGGSAIDAGGGGGASDIRTGGTALSNRIFVAGGGGGGAANYGVTDYEKGGPGGASTAALGAGYSDNQQGVTNGGGQPGAGGTSTAGGTTIGSGATCTPGSGSLGFGGNGCDDGFDPYDPGGGGGYYGGGSGYYAGGGGGSNYADASATGVTNTAGYQSGNGSVSISYLPTLCTSSTRTPVTVTTLSTPAPVTVSGGGTVCGSTTLTATGGTGGTIYWENTTANGTDVSTPSSSQTVSANGTYYFNAYNGTCWATPAGSATVVVNPLAPSVTSTSATPSVICSGQTSSISAVAAGYGIDWWDSPTGGTLLTSVTSGANYTVTPATSPTTTYYAEARVPGAPVVQTFSYTGSTQTWTVPAGAISATVYAWGGGGGGGGANSVSTTNYRDGGGGGGGACSSGNTFTVNAGEIYTITVGAGGTAGTTSGGTAGTGGTSTFSGPGGSISAAGGAGGRGGSNRTGGAGSNTGTTLGGGVIYAGGNGSTAVNGTGITGTGGGGAGSGGAGTSPAATCTGSNAAGGSGTYAGGYGAYNFGCQGLDQAGPAGGVPGGGGAGDQDYLTAYAGGAGGAGQVVVVYYLATGCPSATRTPQVITVNSPPTNATISDVLDPCNGGQTANVAITGGSAPYQFTLTYTGSSAAPYVYSGPSPVELDAHGASSITLSGITDANGCTAASVTGSPATYTGWGLTGGDIRSCTVGANATQVFFDATAKLMAKITASGTALGSTTVATTVDGMVQQFGPTDLQSYLQRHFQITPATQGPANVCLYMSDAEVAALNTSSANNDNHSAPSYYQTFLTDLSNANVTKYDGGLETPSSHTPSLTQVITSITSTHNPTVDGGTYNGVWEMCFNVSGFSGFYVHAANVNNNPLPVTLISFTATAEDNKFIQLNWSTATEIDNAGFQIERSTDGVNYEAIGFAQGHGNSSVTNDYRYNDMTATPGIVYYYRLKQEDVDGHFKYSDIVSATLTGTLGFTLETLLPNPATNQVSLGVISNVNTPTTITFTDMLGREVLKDSWNMSIGFNTNRFDVSTLAEGSYLVTIRSGNNISSKRLAVTH